MKHTYSNLFVLLLFLLTHQACKKEISPNRPGTSSLTIVNGALGNRYLLMNFNGINLGVPNYDQLVTITYGNSMIQKSYSGQVKLALYQVTDTTSTGKPLYNLQLNLPLNTIHTLYLMGTPQAPDTLFTTDHLPYHPPADSTVSIRFVNMTQGSAPVSVNLIGQVGKPEVQSLPYKGITAFKNYNAGSTISSYTFEFRDKATGNLLGSYTLNGVNNDGSIESPNITRYQNLTIALLGAPAETTPNRVLLIRHK